MHTYQLYIKIDKTIKLQIGKLGKFTFPRGDYIYTGSAKKNINARIKRHFSKYKKNHWHIDYLLENKNVKISKFLKSTLSECNLNQSTIGEILIKGFGNSDCKQNCKSHLKFRS